MLYGKLWNSTSFAAPSFMAFCLSSSSLHLHLETSAMASHSADSPLRKVRDSVDNKSTPCSASMVAARARAPGTSDNVTRNSTNRASGSANGTIRTSFLSRSAINMTYIPSESLRPLRMDDGIVTLPLESIRTISDIRMVFTP